MPKGRGSRRRKRGGSKRRKSSTRKRKKINVQKAIKHPGALKRKRKKGESTEAAARRLKKSGSPQAKRQANFFLNVLKGRRKR